MMMYDANTQNFLVIEKQTKLIFRQIFSWISSFAVKPSFSALQHGRSILFLFIQPPRAKKKGKGKSF